MIKKTSFGFVRSGQKKQIEKREKVNEKFRKKEGEEKKERRKGKTNKKAMAEERLNKSERNDTFANPFIGGFR